MKNLFTSIVIILISTTLWSQGEHVNGLTGTFNKTNDQCLLSNTPQSMTFTPDCPTGPDVQNVSYEVTFSTIGGIQIASQSTNGNVGFSMVTTPVAQNLERFNNGRIYADYTCTYEKIVEVQVPCSGSTVTTTVTVPISKVGRSYIDFFQENNWNANIVGPKCVREGETVTYSIFDFVSGPVSPQDIYTWSIPTGWTFLYNSEDGSSITVNATTLDAGNDQISVQVGKCNSNISVLNLQSAGEVPEPTIQSEYCLAENQTTWNVGFVNPIDPTIDYQWDITADGNGYTFAFGDENTQGGIGVNIGNQSTGFIVLISTVESTGGGCPDADRTDTIRFERTVDGAPITGPTCVDEGQTYTYTIAGLNNDTKVNWSLPTQMSITSTDIQASTIDVVVNGPMNSGSITASIASGCGGWIQGLYNVNTNPLLTSLTGPTCVAPNTNATYIATGSSFFNVIWTVPTGMSNGGGTTLNTYVSNTFTGGTVSAIATKSGCPDSDPVSIDVSVDPTGTVLSGITASKSCLNNGLADMVTLTTDIGFETYTWTLPSGWSINGTTGIVTTSTSSVIVTTDGTAGTVRVTGNNSCGSSDPTTISLTAEGAGNVAIESAVLLGINFLVAEEVPGATYQWFQNGTAITGETSRTLNLSTPGAILNEYCVDVTLNSCITRSCTTSTFTPALKVAAPTKEKLESDISISPNPASTLVKIGATAELTGISFTIINMTGQEMISSTFLSTGTSVAVSTWADGTYILHYTLNEKVYSKIFQVLK